jgi:hypothetical protein
MFATCQLMAFAATTPISRKFVIRSIPISDCSGQCEWHGSGRVMVGWWQGNGMVCVNRSLKRQGNGMGTAWPLCHGTAFSVLLKYTFVSLWEYYQRVHMKLCELIKI